MSQSSALRKSGFFLSDLSLNLKFQAACVYFPVLHTLVYTRFDYDGEKTLKNIFSLVT